MHVYHIPDLPGRGAILCVCTHTYMERAFGPKFSRATDRKVFTLTEFLHRENIQFPFHSRFKKTKVRRSEHCKLSVNTAKLSLVKSEKPFCYLFSDRKRSVDNNSFSVERANNVLPFRKRESHKEGNKWNFVARRVFELSWIFIRKVRRRQILMRWRVTRA